MEHGVKAGSGIIVETYTEELSYLTGRLLGRKRARSVDCLRICDMLN